MHKEEFLKNEFVSILKEIDLSTEAVFGKMNFRQMIEHMAQAFQIASGKLIFENKQQPELTEKMYRFMMSEKPFRDNTPNPNLPQEPLSLKFGNIQDALSDLQNEINFFLEVFQEDGIRIENPFFGDLNKAEQIHLLHKHALHHLRQFGVTP